MPICSPMACYKLLPIFSYTLLPDAFDGLTLSQAYKPCLIPSSQSALPSPAAAIVIFELLPSLHSAFHTPAFTGLCSQSPHTFSSKDVNVGASDNFGTPEIRFLLFFILPN